MVESSVNESALIRDVFVSKIKFQIKMSIFFFFFHTFCYWPLGLYSYKLFLFMSTAAIFTGVMYYMELNHQAAGQVLKAIFFGTAPALLMVSKPEYAILAAFSHFFAINMGFYDIDLSKLHYLLGSFFK